MGEPIRVVISLDEETQQRLARWQEQFSMLVGDNRSRLVRLALETLDWLGFTPDTVIAAMNQAQRIKVINFAQSQFNFPSASITPQQLGPKPPVRAINPTTPGSSRGRRLSAIKRVAVVGQAKVHRTWGTSLSGHLSPFNSNSYARVA